MTGLLRAEVRRITSRRLIRVFAIVALGITLLTLGNAFRSSHRDDPAAVQRRAEQQAERARAECEAMVARDEFPPDFDCDNFSFSSSDFYQDRRLFARRELPNGVKQVAVGMAVAAFLVGATYVGAEWHAGTMQALLFWEPRRGRVLAGKALALVGVMVVATLALQVLVYLGTYVTAATRGSTEGVTDGLHQANALTMLRGMGIVTTTALLGFAVAGLARITGAALGAAFVYFAIIENMVRGLRPGWQRFLIGENIVAVLNKQIRVAPANSRNLIDAFIEDRMYVLTSTRGAITLALYLTLLIGIFYVTFTRRDVT